MWGFVLLFFIVTGVAAWLTSFRYKRTQQLSWMPAIILTVVSGGNALINYVLADGWAAMGFLFMFIAVSVGGFVGCGIMYIVYKRKQAT